METVTQEYLLYPSTPCTWKTHSLWPLMLTPSLEAGVVAEAGAHVAGQRGSVKD